MPALSPPPTGWHAAGGPPDYCGASGCASGAAAWKAGKLVSLHFPPAPDAIERARAWAARGAQCLTIGGDTQVLFGALRERLGAVRG